MEFGKIKKNSGAAKARQRRDFPFGQPREIIQRRFATAKEKPISRGQLGREPLQTDVGKTHQNFAKCNYCVNNFTNSSINRISSTPNEMKAVENRTHWRIPLDFFFVRERSRLGTFVHVASGSGNSSCASSFT